MTTAIPPTIIGLIARLQQQAAVVGVARNVLNENTARAQAGLHDTEHKLEACINGLTSTPRDLEAEEARLVKLEEQRAIVLAKQAEIENALVDAPDWRLASDGRARDRGYSSQQTLRMQLHRLREGTLLFAPNQVYGRLEDLDTRIKESNERVVRLRTQLAAHLQQAEGLLKPEPVTK